MWTIKNKTNEQIKQLMEHTWNKPVVVTGEKGEIGEGH